MSCWALYCMTVTVFADAPVARVVMDTCTTTAFLLVQAKVLGFDW